MAISQILINRPGLGRTLSLKDIADPLRFFGIEHDYLGTVLHSLSAVADDLHRVDRHDRADAIVDYFRVDFHQHIEDEEAALELLEREPAASACGDGLFSELRGEHTALDRLLPPVVDGLEEISVLGTPLAPSRFVIASLVLSEFLRLHVNCVRTQLMPLAAATMGSDDIRDLSRDMAFRRGMGPC
jgi:hypothetical protein